MIVQYMHTSALGVKKTYDTEKALKNNPFIEMSQEEFDEMELKHFEQDKHIIWFEVIKQL